MFRKLMKVAVVAAVVAVSGSALAAGGKKPNMTPREVSGVVNINTASTRELEMLPGVGKHTASLIVAHREKTPFKAPNEILKVKGVGNGIYRKIKQHLTISGATTLSASKADPAAPSGASNTAPAARTEKTVPPPTARIN
ncbi:MAG: helix-hairpin-helix domain-containing protein [Deltaproteobacteria bacterium]|nr:helix-hairpin-helix domain-containing protein [Deltaproteobacteria bacterium]